MRSTSLEVALAVDEGDVADSVTPITTLRIARSLPSEWASLPMDCEARSQ